MSAAERPTDRLPLRAWLCAVPALALPALAYAGLRAHPSADIELGAPLPHFYIVSAIAMLALLLAVAVGVAARHLPDARTFFLALGFLAMAAIFLAHGAGTGPFAGTPAGPEAPPAAANSAPPEAPAYGMPAAAAAAPQADDDDASYGAAAATARLQAVGFSARLSLMVSALCFLLAVLDLRSRVAEAIVRRWTPLAGAAAVLLGGYVCVALFAPTWLNWIPMSSQPLSWGVAGVAWAGLAIAGWHFLQAFRLARLPMQGLLALTMGWLIEAQWFMLRGPVWHLSWWEYHVVMLLGFLVAVAGLLWEYSTAGDLGAVVEALFLRTQVQGLRHGDPHALTQLVTAVSAKDTETDAHTERVADLAVGIGERLGRTGRDLDLLRWAGRLHDVGKLGVPNSILRKPGRLTVAERAVIERHTTRGWRVASRSALLAEVAPLIRAHHERIDGTGYPDGLAGEQIPLEARVIAVADVWDALTCDRPYRRAMPFDQAAVLLRREAGRQLDARCVDALFAHLAERGAPQRLSA